MIEMTHDAKKNLLAGKFVAGRKIPTDASGTNYAHC
jgi:hypothetical protein